MQGQSRVLSKRLQALHKETVEAAGYFAGVTFRHVPREENRLADAGGRGAVGAHCADAAPRDGQPDWVSGEFEAGEK